MIKKNIKQYLTKHKIKSEILESLSDRCKISIVIPALNEELYIKKCLNSLRYQKTLRNANLDLGCYEVIIVDNGSSDNTASVVKKFQKTHPEFRLYYIYERKKGVAWARKKGMDQSILRYYKRGLSNNKRFILASTDADAIVNSKWIDSILRLFFSNLNISCAGGPFHYRKKFILNFKKLDFINLTWAKIQSILKPMDYTETVGSNFAIEANTYSELGGMPLLTTGEDLTISELAIAMEKIVGEIPCSNLTSERRAMLDPVEFITGAKRYLSMGSEGEKLFQDARAFRKLRNPFKDLDENKQKEILDISLRYFIRHHIIKPLIFIKKFRAPILKELFHINLEGFSENVNDAFENHKKNQRLFLDDIVLYVDNLYNYNIYCKLKRYLNSFSPEEMSTACNEIPFHCKVRT